MTDRTPPPAPPAPIPEDPWLRVALRHAPDADLPVPAPLRTAILAQARAAVAGTPAASAGGAAAQPSTASPASAPIQASTVAPSSPRPTTDVPVTPPRPAPAGPSGLGRVRAGLLAWVRSLASRRPAALALGGAVAAGLALLLLTPLLRLESDPDTTTVAMRTAPAADRLGDEGVPPQQLAQRVPLPSPAPEGEAVAAAPGGPDGSEPRAADRAAMAAATASVARPAVTGAPAVTPAAAERSRPTPAETARVAAASAGPAAPSTPTPVTVPMPPPPPPLTLADAATPTRRATTLPLPLEDVQNPALPAARRGNLPPVQMAASPGAADSVPTVAAAAPAPAPSAAPASPAPAMAVAAIDAPRDAARAASVSAPRGAPGGPAALAARHAAVARPLWPWLRLAQDGASEPLRWAADGREGPVGERQRAWLQALDGAAGARWAVATEPPPAEALRLQRQLLRGDGQRLRILRTTAPDRLWILGEPAVLSTAIDPEAAARLALLEAGW